MYCEDDSLIGSQVFSVASDPSLQPKSVLGQRL